MAPTIKSWLDQASYRLKQAGISSHWLDSELILAHVLQQDRTYLHAHDNQTIDKKSRQIASKHLRLRQKRYPLAYITGYKEFYGRNFRVTPDALIPRPESEQLITTLADLLKTDPLKYLVDVGTGSGCLGITAKLEHPDLSVALIDISTKALHIARENATTLNAEVTTQKGDLLNNYQSQPDIILANLPYVDKAWQRSPETEYEPKRALFAKENGLFLVNKLIIQSASLLRPGGYLLLEIDPRQNDTVEKTAWHHGFQIESKQDFCLCLQLTGKPRAER